MNVKKMIENQKNIFNLLKHSKQNNRLSHAYLFYGAEGVGKKEMAYALACLEYCPNGGCLECDVCKSIIEGKHLNVDYIGILDNKKLISKEQITELQEEFSKTSLVDGQRIYIVDGIDTASTSAQNSLLKFIEEPINNTATTGIFIAEDLSNVVSTIISRCSLIHFPSLSIKQLVNNLVENDINLLDASLASIITNNSEEAIMLIESNNFLISKKFFLDFLELSNSKEAVLFYIKNSDILVIENISLFFKWLIAFYEDLFKVDDKDNLILTSLYDKMNVYLKKGYNRLKEEFSLVLELYSKLDYNVIAKNVFHSLIVGLF